MQDCWEVVWEVWEAGELGRVAGWLRKLLALTAAKEWGLSEMTAPAEVCRCILCQVGCTDSLAFKKKVGRNYLYDLFVLSLYLCCWYTSKMWKTQDRLIICICGEDEYNSSAVDKAFQCILDK